MHKHNTQHIASNTQDLRYNKAQSTLSKHRTDNTRTHQTNDNKQVTHYKQHTKYTEQQATIPTRQPTHKKIHNTQQTTNSMPHTHQTAYTTQKNTHQTAHYTADWASHSCEVNWIRLCFTIYSSNRHWTPATPNFWSGRRFIRKKTEWQALWRKFPILLNIDTYRHTDRNRHTYVHTDRHTCIHTSRHTDIHTNIHTRSHTVTHTVILTCRHT